MSLTALVEDHDQQAADVSPVVYAMLRALRYLQDGRNFVEGDFREWIAEGERLRGATTVPPPPGYYPDGVPVEPVPLTTGDDDRPHPFGPEPNMQNEAPRHDWEAMRTPPYHPDHPDFPPLTPAQQRMAKARAAKAARKGA